MVIYKHESQVYGSASKAIALESPLPPGTSLEDKLVGFITWHPDEQQLMFHPLDPQEVLSATVKEAKKKKNDKETSDTETQPE